MYNTNRTMKRTLGISEARKLLPQIVSAISRDGGRVDVTHRGRPSVSIVRTQDVSVGSRRGGNAPGVADLRVEFLQGAGRLRPEIKTLRARAGTARPFPIVPSARRRG